MTRYTLRQKDGTEREFWCPDNGGYVWEVLENGSHRQVSDHLGPTGDMMTASANTLADKVRAARRRELRRLREYEGWS